MKIITVNVPDSYIKQIEKMMITRIHVERSVSLRLAIRDLLIKEMRSAQKLDKEFEKKKKVNITHIFDYCINCEKELDNLVGQNQKNPQNYQLFGLNFCCSCYEKFKDKSFYELPIHLIDRIKNKIFFYEIYIENSVINKSLIKGRESIQKLEKKIEKFKIVHIFDYCINCGKILDNLARDNQKLPQNYELFGLNFCSSCYEKFKDKGIDEFPEYSITRIKKKINAYKDCIVNSDIKKSLIKGIESIQKLEKEIENFEIANFFNYCINCGRKLHSSLGKIHKFHKNYEIFELKFCCSCYKTFKDKSFNDFPAYLINRIKEKVKLYKDYMENSNKSNSAK